MKTDRREKKRFGRLKLIKSTGPESVWPPPWDEQVFKNLLHWDEELWDFAEEFERNHGYEPNCVLIAPELLAKMMIILNNNEELWGDAVLMWVHFDYLRGPYDLRLLPYDGVPDWLINVGWQDPDADDE